jgi:3-hydroxybutyryl-CoA dehydrogenase
MHQTAHVETTNPFMTVAIVGAGLMGSGIAQVAAQAGHNVSLFDLDPEGPRRGLRQIKASYDRFVAKGTLDAAAVDQALARIEPTADFSVVSAADIVIEAVFEDLAVKRSVFAELDRQCRPGTVLATNTSAIPITAVASATARPESVIGTHFFSPVPMMRLCELVRGRKTSDATVARARGFAEGIGKTCVMVERDCAGFVTTRLIAALTLEAARLVDSGIASPKDIDRACQLGFGHAMGPLATLDLTGVDVMVNAARAIYAETQDEKFFPPEGMLRMLDAGDLGRKTGNGFYRYDT